MVFSKQFRGDLGETCFSSVSAYNGSIPNSNCFGYHSFYKQFSGFGPIFAMFIQMNFCPRTWWGVCPFC
jgi:hypothetical protein